DAYLIRKASFLSLPAFISSRIQRGVAPRPAQVSLGFFLLRYLGATLRPFSAEPPLRPGGRPRRLPLPTSVPARRARRFCRSAACSLNVAVMLSRRSIRASSDILAMLLGRAMGFS